MREIRDLAWTPRWGVLRVIRRQSVAEHSFYVAVYSALICDAIEISPTLRNEVMDWAIFHDAAEQFMTDIPGPVKREIADPHEVQKFEDKGLERRFGASARLNSKTRSVVRAIVKVADYLDEVCYLIGESRLGNKEVEEQIPQSKLRMQRYLDDLVAQVSVATRREALQAVVDNIISAEMGRCSLTPDADCVREGQSR